MFKKIKFTCIGNVQTHSDKKRASFIAHPDEEDCQIMSVAITYKSNAQDSPIFEKGEFYKIHVPQENPKVIKEPTTDENQEE